MRRGPVQHVEGGDDHQGQEQRVVVEDRECGGLVLSDLEINNYKGSKLIWGHEVEPWAFAVMTCFSCTDKLTSFFLNKILSSFSFLLIFL